MEEKILEILEGINEGILSYTGNNMIADGIINSFEIIEIVATIEEEFDIEIDAGDITAVNFKNKDAILCWLERYLRKEAE